MKKKLANYEFFADGCGSGVVAAKSKGHAASIIAKLYCLNLRTDHEDYGWLIDNGDSYAKLRINFIEYQ